MSRFSGSFAGDFDRIALSKSPVALSRFHDGEYRVLEGLPYDARSGWHLRGESWLRGRLLDALQADLDGYWVGVSPPCDWPVGTAYYRRHTSARRITFATLFWHQNYARFRAARRNGPLRNACVVSCKNGDYAVPANGVSKPWDLDGLVTELLKERRPILVAAGPCACVIVHEYWKRAKPRRRQKILDVGASLDHEIHKKTTRHYQEKGSPFRRHVCSWTQSVPWSSKAKPREDRRNAAKERQQRAAARMARGKKT